MHFLIVLHEKVGYLKVCLDIIQFSNPQFTPDTSAFRLRSNPAVEVGEFHSSQSVYTGCGRDAAQVRHSSSNPELSGTNTQD